MKKFLALLLKVNLFCILVVFVPFESIAVKKKYQIQYLQQLSGDFIIGKQDAKHTIIEYSSLTCSHCAYFHHKVLPRIKEKLIDTGEFKWITRLYVSDSPSMRGASLAVCAGKKDYYNIIDKLYEKQGYWIYSSDYKKKLKELVFQIGMDSIKFNQCIDNKEIQNYLTDVRIIAKTKLGVHATPTFYVNGIEITLKTFDDFESTVSNIVSKGKILNE